MIELYDYWRSSAAYRVRIALQLKNLEYHASPVHLTEGGGQQHQTEYRELNPQGLVPTLIHNNVVVTQSLAIIEYLDETFPQPKILPESPAKRAYVRSLANIITADTHPLTNLRVVQYLNEKFGANEEVQNHWRQHWLQKGLQSFEAMLSKEKRFADCCLGNEPSLADVCLVPQVYAARRYAADLSQCLIINKIVDHCETLPAFERAKPEAQSDAPRSQ